MKVQVNNTEVKNWQGAELLGCFVNQVVTVKGEQGNVVKGKLSCVHAGPTPSAVIKSHANPNASVPIALITDFVIGGDL